MKDWYYLLATVAQWSPGIPLLLGLIRFRQLSRSQRWLALLLFMALTLQFIGEQIAFVYQNNAPVFHFYIFVETTLIILIYRDELSRLLPFLKRGTLYLVGAFTLLSLTDLIFLNGPYRVPSYARSTEIILIILLGFAYFALIYREMKVLFLERHFLFWFTAGNLLFFSFNFITYFFSNFLNEQHFYVAYFWTLFHSFTVVMLNLLYAVAITRKDPADESH